MGMSTGGANPYDIIHLPGFEFWIAHPESACCAALRARAVARISQ
jgi:hypothetical protein